MEMAEITVYSTAWCYDCRRAKQFLNERGIVFKEVNVDESEEAEEKLAPLDDDGPGLSVSIGHLDPQFVHPP